MDGTGRSSTASKPSTTSRPKAEPREPPTARPGALLCSGVSQSGQASFANSPVAGHLQVSPARVVMRIKRSSAGASVWVSPGAALIPCPKPRSEGILSSGLARSRWARKPEVFLDEAPSGSRMRPPVALRPRPLASQTQPPGSSARERRPVYLGGVERRLCRNGAFLGGFDQAAVAAVSLAARAARL